MEPRPRQDAVAIVGAGIGGLVAAVRFAHIGLPVTVFERASGPGGKMRTRPSVAGPIDAGPTVLTMRSIFDALFSEIGERLDAHLTLRSNPVLARHYWADGTTLDLAADPATSRANVAHVFGSRAAADFTRFSDRAQRLFEAFDGPMMRAAEPSRTALATRVLARPGLIADMAPARSLSASLRGAFREPKLRQLFERYATYVGGTPELSPAVLALIWHAEARGVWSVDGGLHGLARTLEALARARGAVFRYGADVTEIELRDGTAAALRVYGERIPARTILFNGDPRALGQGALGRCLSAVVPSGATEPRSLSAEVHTFAATPSGPPLSAHNVFFGDDPEAEFRPLARGETPEDATLYLCAQDRGGGAMPPAIERFEIIRNAPPIRRAAPDPAPKEIAACQSRAIARLQRFGLTFSPMPEPEALTLPQDFAMDFPESLGSLYGRSPQGTMAAFARPTARTAIPGLYLAGGGAHPGAGVPMAALSGQHAVATILADRTSRSRFRRRAMPGGMSTASATTAHARSRS